MPGTEPRLRTAQGSFAWCVVVIAALAALVLLPCAGGMMMTGADLTAHGGTSTMAVDTATTGSPMTMVWMEADGPGPSDLGGVLATCLAFLVAVVATAVGLRQVRPRIVAELLTRGHTAIHRAIRARAPDLAQLCLLRT